MPNDDETSKLLDSRGTTHGDYRVGSSIIQRTKNLWRAEAGWVDLSTMQKESLDMFATKIGRILSGDQNDVDHWNDCAGYATLIVEILKGIKR